MFVFQVNPVGRPTVETVVTGRGDLAELLVHLAYLGPPGLLV